MKMKIFRWLFVLVTTLFVSGCVTPRVDWNSRIGHYTFDQAVVELGPPDKQARLSDGRTVAEWISRSQSGSSMSFGTGFYNYPYPSGVGMVQTVGPSYYERKFRLTFTPENILSAWSRN